MRLNICFTQITDSYFIGYRVLDPDWTRGLPGIEAEEELAQKLEDEAMMKRTKDYIGQDDTNWDVEAVVDEDDLFK